MRLGTGPSFFEVRRKQVHFPSGKDLSVVFLVDGGLDDGSLAKDGVVYILWKMEFRVDSLWESGVRGSVL